MKKISLLAEYVRQYQKETEFVRHHRNTWENWKHTPDMQTRFYQGIRTYFNPDTKEFDSVPNEKKPDYYAISRVLKILSESGIPQKDVAEMCGLEQSNASGWKSFRKRPNKYQWWVIAVETGLPADLLDAFLLMVGAVYEPMRIEDQIIYSMMKNTTEPCTRLSVAKALGSKSALMEKTPLNDAIALDRTICKDALEAFGVIQKKEK